MEALLALSYRRGKQTLGGQRWSEHTESQLSGSRAYVLDPVRDGAYAPRVLSCVGHIPIFEDTGCRGHHDVMQNAEKRKWTVRGHSSSRTRQNTHPESGNTAEKDAGGERHYRPRKSMVHPGPFYQKLLPCLLGYWRRRKKGIRRIGAILED